MGTATGIGAGFTAVTPYIALPEIEGPIRFAKQAFGATETGRMRSPSGGVHCELRIGDSMLMFVGGPGFQGGEKLTALHVYVPDAGDVYRRALDAGAASLFEPRDKPYGTREAGVKDAAGNLWYIAQGQRHEALRTVTPYVLVTTALGLIEFLKAAFGASEIGVYKSPEGKLQHAALRIGDAAMEFGEAQGPPFAFYLYAGDAGAIRRQATGAGARWMPPPADLPPGDVAGTVEDGWGITWYIASRPGH